MHASKFFFIYCLSVILCGFSTAYGAVLSQEEQSKLLLSLGGVNVEDMVDNCDYQAIDDDLSANMIIINRNRSGSEKKSIYKRMVKNAKGNDGVLEKMLLVSQYPPEAVGMAFLRWEYTAATDKYPDQWLYTPSLRNVRKVSVRDDGERFLGSTLTLGDIAARALNKDNHQLLQIESLTEDGYLFHVESTPRSAEGYSKRLLTYIYEKDWDSCRVKQIDFYDNKGLLQKIQRNQWQRLGNVWVWSTVDVENLQTQELSTFQLEDVKVNIGLDDEIFSERKLRRAAKMDFAK